MQSPVTKKYSKISPALKCYFLENLYYHCLSIRQAASKCRINYSTAKIMLKELDNKEKKFVKRLLTKKERDQKQGMNVVPVCTYKQIDPTTTSFNSVEVISRLGYDFFQPPQKKN